MLYPEDETRLVEEFGQKSELKAGSKDSSATAEVL